MLNLADTSRARALSMAPSHTQTKMELSGQKMVTSITNTNSTVTAEESKTETSKQSANLLMEQHQKIFYSKKKKDFKI